MKNKNRIIPQMFDIKPVDETGNLDVSRIGKIRKNTISAPAENLNPKKESFILNNPSPINQITSRPKVKNSFQSFHSKPKICQLENSFETDNVPIIQKFEGDYFKQKKTK